MSTSMIVYKLYSFAIDSNYKGSYCTTTQYLTDHAIKISSNWIIAYFGFSYHKFDAESCLIHNIQLLVISNCRLVKKHSEVANHDIKAITHGVHSILVVQMPSTFPFLSVVHKSATAHIRILLKQQHQTTVPWARAWWRAGAGTTGLQHLIQ